MIRISGAVIAGLRVKSVPAVYPRLAKIGHQSGSVVVRVLISKDGIVEKAEVMKSTNAMFNESALDAVRQWRFKGYVLNGEPVEVNSTVVVNFSLAS
jgi:protein TonB